MIREDLIILEIMGKFFVGVGIGIMILGLGLRKYCLVYVLLVVGLIVVVFVGLE